MQPVILRNFFALSAAALIATAIATRCEAQVSQRVQLPTFHRFGVSTTVLVPDRGSIYLGGVNSSRRGQSSFGMPLAGPSSRAFSRGTNAGGIFISATIIDHNELDRAVLAEAARRRGAKFDVLGRPVDLAAGYRPMKERNPLLQSSLRKPNAPANQSKLRNDATKFHANSKYTRLGRQAEADGDFQSAKIFYELALEQ